MPCNAGIDYMRIQDLNRSALKLAKPDSILQGILPISAGTDVTLMNFWITSKCVLFNQD